MISIVMATFILNATKLYTHYFLPVTVVVVNSMYVKYVARIQTVLTSVKVLALAIIIVVGIVQLWQGNLHYLSKSQ